MPKQEEDPKKAEELAPADELVLLVGALLQADPRAKVLVHDENWVDVGLSPDAAPEKVIRSLRAMSAEFKEHSSKRGRRKELLGDKQEAFVARLPKEVKCGATLCLLEGPKVYIDAIPMALKVALRDFAAEVSTVPASAATMIRGLCADMRAAPDYVPSR